MPPFESVMRFMSATWGMMTNRPDAVRELDTSADGFWESFWAMAVAVPPLMVTWVSFATLNGAEMGLSRWTAFFAAIGIEGAAWILPIAGFVLIASKINLASRMPDYVVATNWGSALLAWLYWPPALLRLMFPALGETAEILELIVYVAILVLWWRLTNAALRKGPAVATAVFMAMLFATLSVVSIVQALLSQSA